MLKSLFFILAFISFAFSILSQDLKLKCDGKDVECENGNKSHFEMIMSCPYGETDTSHLPQIVMINARKYLVDRVGLAFYSRLNYYSCQLIDYSKFDEIKKEKGWISKSGNQRIRYAIQYYFFVQDSMRYYLSIVFDKKGEIISKHQLPDIKRNKRFDKIFDVCDVKLIAAKDSIFKGEMQSISLEYSVKKNTFYWIIEKPPVNGKKPRETIYRYVMINATTGKLMKRRKEYAISVGCTMDF